MSEKLVSVIIPSFKMGQFIGEALESVGAQTYPQWEVIVVDDAGPDDGTRAAVEAFGAKHPRHRVEYIRHDKNQGVSAARNSAIKAAKGEWLAFLDPDDLWKPEHLARGAEVLRTQANIGVTSSSVEAVWTGAQGRTEHWVHGGWTRENFPLSMACWNFIQISSTMARKSEVEAAGGFCEDKELQHIEDYDLWIRLIRNGVGFSLMEEATCQYRKHGEGATADLRRMDELHENLMTRHAGFFLHAQARLLASLVAQSKTRDREMGGFFLRRLVAAGNTISTWADGRKRTGA